MVQDVQGMEQKRTIYYRSSFENISDRLLPQRATIIDGTIIVNTLDKHFIEAEVYKEMGGNISASDGTQNGSVEEQEDQLFYTLRVDTELDFSQAIDFFRRINIDPDSRIIVFSTPNVYVENNSPFADSEPISDGIRPPYHATTTVYRGTSQEDVVYHEKPVVYKDIITPERMHELKDEQGGIFLRMFGRVLDRDDSIDIFYEQRFEVGGAGNKKRKRVISHMDTRVHLPTLQQFLTTAPFEISQKEGQFLADMLNKALLL